MAMEALRPNVALAIDGGGIKGLIVAEALKQLEAELGGKPLIEHEQIKILAGTSTGAIITTGIALGMTMDEITKIYLDDGAKVFPELFGWLPESARGLIKSVVGIFRPYMYSSASLKKILQDRIERFADNRNLTLGELNARLEGKKSLVLTAVDVLERRTKFLKSSDEKDALWELWAATLASSSAPTVMPVVKYNVRREVKGSILSEERYFVDGGVGSYGNPGYIAAREAVDFWGGYKPEDVTVLSFGTGWVPDAAYAKAHPDPDRWNNITWAINVIMLMLADSNRAQSLDIINDYVKLGKMDFRRFQIELDPDIDMTDARPATLRRMQDIGAQLGQRILNNEYVRRTGDTRTGEGKPQFDPEGLLDFAEKVEEIQTEAQQK